MPPRNEDDRPPGGRGSGRPPGIRLSLPRALVVTCVFQAMALGLAWLARDGGSMLRNCAGAALVYWFSATWIIVRRRGRLAHGELMWLIIGFPVLTIAVYAAGPLMRRFRGG